MIVSCVCRWMWGAIVNFKWVDENSYAMIHESVRVNTLCMYGVTSRPENSQPFHQSECNTAIP